MSPREMSAVLVCLGAAAVFAACSSSGGDDAVSGADGGGDGASSDAASDAGSAGDGSTGADSGISCPSAWAGGSCVPYAQSPATVTLPGEASGVTVRQLTNAGNNFLTYVDVAAYGACGRVFYDAEQGPPRSHKTVYSASIDGSNAVQIGHALGAGLEGVYLTGDSQLAYFVSDSDGGVDLFGVPVADPSCAAAQISHRYFVPNDDGDIEVSTPSWDATNHRWVLGFAADSTFHRVASDGTNLPDVPLVDPQSSEIFHRVRLDPVCPNILFYHRNMTDDAGQPTNKGEKEIWTVDLDNDPTNPRQLTSGKANHMVWSPNGAQIGYSASGGSSFAIADVVDTSTCRLRADPYATTHVAPAGGVLQSDFCTWSPDGSILVCDDNCLTDGTTDSVYLMTLSGATAMITQTGRNCASSNLLENQPDAQFYLDAHHVLFVSDASGAPQVYSAELPPTLAP